MRLANYHAVVVALYATRQGFTPLCGNWLTDMEPAQACYVMPSEDDYRICQAGDEWHARLDHHTTNELKGA